MSNEFIWGGLGFLLGLISTFFYIASILKGETRPHLFTWAIWGILSSIAFAAQIFDHAGPGAWALGVTAFSCLVTTTLSVYYGDKDFKRSDFIALAVSLSAIIPWLLSKDPFLSIVIISMIDVVAFYPTLRKSWTKPYQENLASYFISNIKLIFSIFGIENFTFNTIFYTSVVITLNFIFIGICISRRVLLSQQITPSSFTRNI